MGAANRAPKKVPAESRETIMEDWEEVTSGRPSLGLTYPVENISRHFFMAKIPLIVPVSYLRDRRVQWVFTIVENDKRLQKTHPKRTPPKATNRPIMMAGAAEPTASSGFFNAKPIAGEVCESGVGSRVGRDIG